MSMSFLRKNKLIDRIVKFMGWLKLFCRFKMVAQIGKWVCLTVAGAVIVKLVDLCMLNLFECESMEVCNIARYEIIDNINKNSIVTNVKDIVYCDNNENLVSNRYSVGLVSYKVEDRFPCGRIFTYQYKTNLTGTCGTISISRVHYYSKESRCSNSWGIISNSIEFSSCVSKARRMYAKGRYQDAVQAVETATNRLNNLICKTPYSNYIFDWALVVDVTYISEIMAEKAMSEGRYLDAKKIIRQSIKEWPIVPSRIASIYFAADMLSGERDWFSARHCNLFISNDIIRVEHSYETSYVDLDDYFECNWNEVRQQLALWGYFYPIFLTNDGNEYKGKYSDLLGIPDNLPYPQAKRKWGFGDYFGSRWLGLGRYEDYNVSQELRSCRHIADRLRRDGVVR